MIGQEIRTSARSLPTGGGEGAAALALPGESGTLCLASLLSAAAAVEINFKLLLLRVSFTPDSKS